MSLQVIQSEEFPKSQLPYSPAIRVGPWLYVSGQASVDRSGQIVSDDFAGEMRRALGNLQQVLSVAGFELSDVVQTRNYLGSQEHLEEFNQIYREFFPTPYPARTTIMGCLGDLLKYEIDLVAYSASQAE